MDNESDQNSKSSTKDDLVNGLDDNDLIMSDEEDEELDDENFSKIIDGMVGRLSDGCSTLLLARASCVMRYARGKRLQRF